MRPLGSANSPLEVEGGWDIVAPSQMGHHEISACIARAREDARRGAPSAPPDGVRRFRRVAMGDPQAPFGKVLEVLDAHALLGAEGRLRPDVFLVSMGDHFDWGGAESRAVAAEGGMLLLAWLAAHPADQVVLLLGNHDLARVGELTAFDDASFAVAQREADAAHWHGAPLQPEGDFRARFGVPSWEVLARDFAGFRAEQRTLVTALLRAGRFRVAFAASNDLLLTHAGVTLDELQALGVPALHAKAAEAALNGALDAAVQGWKEGPLSVAFLHEPGHAEGEGRGMFYHRPVALEAPYPAAKGTLHRRFDIRRLPRGLSQVVGHTRDDKARELLRAGPSEARVGPIRHAVVRGLSVDYAHGAGPLSADADAAILIFIDGAMAESEVSAYELFDIDKRRPHRAEPSLSRVEPAVSIPLGAKSLDARRLLRERSLLPKKSFGQNFLVESSIAMAIAVAAVPEGEVGRAHVIEIGAGTGALTKALASRAEKVTAVERDRDLVPVLNDVFQSEIERGTVAILEADAQALDLPTLFGARHGDTARVLVGNLPYQITGRLLTLAVEAASLLTRAVFMVQEEVADRLLADPSTKAYGALTVFVRAAFDVSRVLQVSPGSFYPSPRVTSAVVRLVPVHPPRAQETDAFRAVVKAAFAMRRKTLRNAWRGLFPSNDELARAAEECGISLDARGETLDVAAFARMAERLALGNGA